MKDYTVLLYYKYIDIPDPQKIRVEQMKLCQKLHLRGRIIIANEGINGTVEGTTKDTQQYISQMDKQKLFKGISYKKSQGTGQAFPKLSVKVRPEIVALGRPDLNPTKLTGTYLSPDELHSLYESQDNFIILDMRNDYEQQSGYFEGSQFIGTRNFYDLPKVLPKLKQLKDKKVVTVCTGGVRCEKGSALLLQEGFKRVYQLKDGIQSYMEKYPNQHFKGKLYVFDNRLTLGFETNDPKHEVVGKCLHCGAVCDSYVNCAYNFCHFHYISCQDCLDKELKIAFCKAECREKYLKQNHS